MAKECVFFRYRAWDMEVMPFPSKKEEAFSPPINLGERVTYILSTSFFSIRDVRRSPPPSTSKLEISFFPNQERTFFKSIFPDRLSEKDMIWTPVCFRASAFLEVEGWCVNTTIFPLFKVLSIFAWRGNRRLESMMTRVIRLPLHRECRTVSYKVFIPTIKASCSPRKRWTYSLVSREVIQRESRVLVAILPSRLVATFAVTKGILFWIYLL